MGKKQKTTEVTVKAVEMILSPENKHIRIPNVELQQSALLTSAHSVDSKLIVTDTALPSTKQVVVKAGPNSKYKQGDFVKVNFRMFPVEKVLPKHEIGEGKPTLMVPIYEINSVEYMYLHDNHIMWKYNDSKTK